jgi:hypothetical protein
MARIAAWASAIFGLLLLESGELLGRDILGPQSGMAHLAAISFVLGSMCVFCFERNGGFFAGLMCMIIGVALLAFGGVAG